MRFRPLVIVVCLIPFAAGAATEPVFGTWLSEKRRVMVEIGPCGDAPDAACGRIVWMAKTEDANGKPFTDQRNQDESLRDRPIMGLPILTGFQKDGEDSWTNGRIYNPEDGKTYNSSLTLKDANTLLVEGCVLFFCREQVWARARG